MAARGSSFVLDMVRPLAALMPAVRRPDRAVPFHQRVLYTGLSVSVFLVCSHLPLYGVRYAGGGADPLYWVRSVLASNRGTLMELGVGPVVTAGTLVQILTAAGLIRGADGRSNGGARRRDERDLVDGARKVLAAAIALGEAAAYVLLLGGTHGALDGALVVLQLFSATVLVVFLDELFDKGYGLPECSAVSLLSATSTCGKVIWHAFSPVTVNAGGRGPEFEGVVLAVIHQAFVVGAGNGSARARVVATMLRRHLPNVTSLLATGLVVLAAVYLEGVRLLLPLQSRAARGRRATFPIKLLYTSTTPIFLYSAVVSALYMVSQLLRFFFGGGGVLGRLLGVWKEDAGGYGAVPVAGLAYYVTPPSSSSVAADPLHALVYAVLLLASCAVLSQLWVVTSGSSAKDVARQLADQRLAMPGRRDGATYEQLKRHIPTAAAVGGLCVGALSIFADMAGAIGSGTGIMLAATVVYNLVNSFHNHKED